jgi:hypothetical protein
MYKVLCENLLIFRQVFKKNDIIPYGLLSDETQQVLLKQGAIELSDKLSENGGDFSDEPNHFPEEESREPVPEKEVVEEEGNLPENSENTVSEEEGEQGLENREDSVFKEVEKSEKKKSGSLKDVFNGLTHKDSTKSKGKNLKA